MPDIMIMKMPFFYFIFMFMTMMTGSVSMWHFFALSSSCRVTSFLSFNFYRNPQKRYVSPASQLSLSNQSDASCRSCRPDICPCQGHVSHLVHTLL